VNCCGCGCGRLTAFKFLRGHNSRLRPKHHYPEGGGRTSKDRLHRIRAAAALGKPLPPSAQIHHVDNDPTNPNARLVICQDQDYHRLLHLRAKVLKAGGNPNTDVFCRYCHRLIALTIAVHLKQGPRNGSRKRVYACRGCIRARNQATYWRRRARLQSPDPVVNTEGQL